MNSSDVVFTWTDANTHNKVVVLQSFLNTSTVELPVHGLFHIDYTDLGFNVTYKSL